MGMENFSVPCVILAIAAGSFWLGRTSAHAQTKDRVFELRTYTAEDGKLEALHARFRDHTTKIFQKHGMTNVGYWSPADEPLAKNTLVYLLAFPSREAAKQSWAAFRNDPEWKKVQAESEAQGKLVKKVDSVFMNPTDYSPLK
jgi:hypothetical protein